MKSIENTIKQGKREGNARIDEETKKAHLELISKIIDKCDPSEQAKKKDERQLEGKDEYQRRTQRRR